ncbi:harpin-induced protein 1 domain containing protein [Musa troglodytarum]|uniref:Harpin-induced protein 1 domain containing protein n=1 Tax=Musa troglodytarum TaxID=320322 RepID=A0A9E7I0J0_9LILI|nr:harpin-induced protein 1 domain containing protein [Musa troglodytarum]
MEKKEQTKPVAVASAEKKEQTKPVAVSSPSADATDEAAAIGRLPARRLRKRRCALFCFLCWAASAVMVGVVVLVLSFTLFKVKDPTLTMNSLVIERIDLDFGTDRSRPLSINATLDADISIENPNMASFRFGNCTTDFYYSGETVGVAYAPFGKVPAHRTVRLGVRVDVFVDRVATQLNLTMGILTGNQLRLRSYTDIRGRVSVLGVYKRDIELMLNCSIAMEVSIAEQQITGTDCLATVK